MSSKRASTMPPPPKPPTTLAPTLIIAEHASLVGTFLIALGANTAIHPRTKLISTFASITVGSNCIISERSIVGLQSEPENDVESEGLVLEDSVVVETGAVVEARCVGTGTTVEVGARIGKGAVIGKHCKIGPLSEIGVGEEIPDFTVIFGNGMRRVDRSGVENQKLKTIARQVEVLRKLIPSNLAKFQ